MLSPAQLAFLVGLPLCDCFGGELFAVILHPFGFAAHPEPGTTPSNVRETRKPPSVTYSGLKDVAWEQIAPGCVSGGKPSSANLVKYTGKSVADCQALCIEYGPECLGFEYGVAYGGAELPYQPSDCQLQSSNIFVCGLRRRVPQPRLLRAPQGLLRGARMEQWRCRDAEAATSTTDADAGGHVDCRCSSARWSFLLFK